VKLCPKCAELWPDDGAFCPLDGSALVVSSDPLLGRTLSSRYRLVKKLGAGGMATVYLARHVMIDRLNAIKILRKDLGLDPLYRERFLREARAVNRINHPNIVEITDFGEMDDLAYLVMEFASGDSLLTHLKRGVFPWTRAAKVGLQVASALARAHQAGVIHRDLKPENVILIPFTEAGVEEDRVKLTDFGIAKIIDAPALTFSEQMFGTPGYIAPEYVEGAPSDGRADIYALGVLIYEAISGSLPYDARTQAEKLLRPLTTAPTPLSTKVEGIPPELDSLLLGMLAKKPEDRPPDGLLVHDTLIDVLRRYAPETSVPKKSLPPPSAVPFRDEQPTDVVEVEGVPVLTAELGRRPTSEMASRWNAAIHEIEASVARARRKNKPEGLVARAEELLEHARNLVGKVERATANVAEIQGRVDRIEAHAREYRANLGRAIDEISRDRSRERAHRNALKARRDEVREGAPRRDDLTVWEAAALRTEEDRARATEEDLTYQLIELQTQLEAKNERYERDHAEATGELEGAISAVRAMTNELVRTLDECAAIVSMPKRRP
jgi:serine/threonine-protein kinase